MGFPVDWLFGFSLLDVVKRKKVTTPAEKGSDSMLSHLNKNHVLKQADIAECVSVIPPFYLNAKNGIACQQYEHLRIGQTEMKEMKEGNEQRK